MAAHGCGRPAGRLPCLQLRRRRRRLATSRPALPAALRAVYRSARPRQGSSPSLGPSSRSGLRRVRVWSESGLTAYGGAPRVYGSGSECDHDGDRTARPVRGRRFRLLYSRQPTAPTACQLPLPPVARALLNYTLMYSNGTECTGSSLAETLGGRGLLLTVGDCGPDVTPGTRVYYNTINHTNTTWQTIIGLVGWKYSVHCQSSDWRLKLWLLLIGKR